MRSLQFGQNLSKKSSYSSIKEFLRSPEIAAPLEAVKRASDEYSISGRVNPFAFTDSTPSSVDFEVPLQRLQACIKDKSWSDSCGSSDDSYPMVGYSRGAYSDGGYSRASGNNSAISAASTSSTFHSHASSCRVQVKKGRRKRYMAKLASDEPKRYCSFCGLYFKLRKELDDHEKCHSAKKISSCNNCGWNFEQGEEFERHVRAKICRQNFPCTFCPRRFKTQVDWEDHETTYHCQPHLTWFCMLDTRLKLEKCLFCGGTFPSPNHYVQRHNLQDCCHQLHHRTFSTRYNLLQHLVTMHGMRQEEVALIDVDYWSLRIDTSRNCGFWRCGYCGLVGTDWDHRLQHILEHWNKGGPEFTHRHPWSAEMSSLQDLDVTREGKKCRPTDLGVYGYEVFEAAVKQRARFKGGKRIE